MTARRPFDDLGALPAPDPAARAHGERVAAAIRAEIARAGGGIPFARYMDLALHAPGLGYYSAGSTKLGAAGDFVTAPEISPLFGRCIARQAAEVLAMPGGGSILEIGAGSGALACDLLTELERMEALPERYTILEISADLRERQIRRIDERIPHLAARVEWIDRLPSGGFRGLVLANEVLDALPVHRVRVDAAGKLTESCVSWEQDRFVWTWGPSSDARLAPRVEAILTACGPLAPGYCFEINLELEAWIAAVAAALERGLILLVDYGYPRREYYHPERSGGTLMCHYRHRAHDDPLILPGLQDITAHVDFTAVAEAGTRAGLEVAGYATQAWFLLGSGLQELAARALEGAPDVERARISHQVQRLTLPGEMGERFKVMALARDLDQLLGGFSLRDERGRL